MPKSIVTKLFVGSLIAVVGGIALAGAGVLLAFASGVFVMDGPDVTGVNWSAFGGSMIVLMVVGTLAIVGGAIGQFVAWIGAVLNTARLDDKTWFLILLVLGLLSFGFIPMLVYVIVGPDSSSPEFQATHTAARPVA